MQRTTLCDVEEQEGHHESEETSGLSKGETQNGILEKLAPEGGVAGDTLDETAENRSDTDTSTGKTDRGDTGTLDLGGSDHGGGGGLSDDAAGLDHVAAGVVLEGIAEDAVLHEGVVGRLDADGGWRGCVNGCLMQLGGSMEMDADGRTLGGHIARGRLASGLDRASGHAGGAEGASDGNHCDGVGGVGGDGLGMELEEQWMVVRLEEDGRREVFSGSEEGARA